MILIKVTGGTYMMAIVTGFIIMRIILLFDLIIPQSFKSHYRDNSMKCRTISCGICMKGTLIFL
jgi:hypothetical protein